MLLRVLVPAVLACVLGCASTAPPGPASSPPLVDIPPDRAVDGGPIDVPPTPIVTVQPTYPEAAKQAGVSGKVLLQVEVDAQGSPVEVRVLQSVPELDGACIEAMWGWRFTPAKRYGNPIGAWVTVPFDFHFSGGSER